MTSTTAKPRPKVEDGKGHIFQKIDGGTWYLRFPKVAGGKTRSLHTKSKYEAERERDRLLAPFLAKSKIEFLESIKAQIATVKQETAEISDKFALCPLCTKDDKGNIIKFDALDLFISLGSTEKDLAKNTLRTWKMEWRRFLKWLEERETKARQDQKKALAAGKMMYVYPVERISDVDSVIASDYISYIRLNSISNSWMHNVYRFRRIWREFGKLSEHSYFLKNPWESVHLTGKHSKSHKRNLEDFEIRKVFEAVKDDPVMLLFVEIAVYTGMRKVDVCNLKFTDFTEDFSFINLLPTKTKRSGKEYRIAVPNQLKEIIIRQKGKVLHDIELDEEKRNYVCWDLKRMYESHYIDRKMEKVFKRAGIKTFETIDGKKRMVVSTHSFRHSYISTLANSGKVDIETTRKLASHASDAITRDIYEHLADERLTAAVANIPDYALPPGTKKQDSTVEIPKKEYEELLRIKTEFETLKRTLSSIQIHSAKIT